MRHVLKVLSRCLVAEFYKQNAALFGLLFIILFGFIKASEHIAIGSFLVANPFALLILYVIWSGYGVKVILFIIPALNLKENQFLETFSLMDRKVKILATSWISILLLLPVIGYAFFLVFLGISQSFFNSLLSIAFFFIAFLGFIVIIILKKLAHLPYEKSYFHIRILNKYTKPYYTFFIEHMLRHEIILIFLSKIYTCSIIIGASVLYATDTFDLRLYQTGILLSIVGNVAIIHKYIWFYFHELKFMKNLPISFLQSFMIQSITFLIILFPEMVVMLRYYPLPIQFFDLAGILIFGYSIFLLTYSLLLLRQMELSDFLGKLFWLIVITTFFILFSVHPFILGLLFILLSFLIIYLRYYKFEFIERRV